MRIHFDLQWGRYLTELFLTSCCNILIISLPQLLPLLLLLLLLQLLYGYSKPLATSLFFLLLVLPTQLRCCLLCCQSHLKSVVRRDHETLVAIEIGGSTTFVHLGDFKLAKICWSKNSHCNDICIFIVVQIFPTFYYKMLSFLDCPHSNTEVNFFDIKNKKINSKRMLRT